MIILYIYLASVFVAFFITLGLTRALVDSDSKTDEEKITHNAKRTKTRTVRGYVRLVILSLLWLPFLLYQLGVCIYPYIFKEVK